MEYKENKQNRIVWIDTMRGICSFCVLLAHSGCCPSLFFKIYTPFFLVTFFFLSGYCHKQRQFLDSVNRWWKKLLLPYFSLAMILILLSVENLKMGLQGNFNGYFNDILMMLQGRPLWFVACLTTAQLYFILLCSIVKNNIQWLITMVICFILMFFLKNDNNIVYTNFTPNFWYFDTAILGLAFFIMGHLCKQNNLIENIVINKKQLSTVPLYLLVSIAIPEICNVEFHMITNYFANYWYFIAISILGMYAIYVVSNRYSNNYLNLLGYNSLLLFASSGKIHQVMDALNFDFMRTYLSDWLYCIIFCVVQGLLIILLSKIVNKWCPIIVGK